IVVSGGEYEEAGSFGDVLANACLAKGIAGLVTDTGVRDTAELIKLGFPVFSLSVCIKGTVKETLGQVNDPVIVGGEVIRPGDIIRGDADGLVVVRREDGARAVELSAAREAAEAGYIAAYKAGKSVIEVSNLAPVLAAKGLTTDE
ncbi:MAG TPA: S-adenosylmethionine--2-demethylmenaquinone methyltransferase, partial [Paracoccaceae bacterium]